jgi:hypothetical protein
MEHIVPKEDLIDFVKPFLKARGFRKKNKRWTKDIGDFTLCFYIQGSCYSKEDYYIRPGVFINALPSDAWMYGHFMTEIQQTTPEEILTKFEKWCEEWTNRDLIKARLLAFIEWEKRNPLENRRANLVNYDTDPVPAKEFFAASLQTKQYILDNF